MKRERLVAARGGRLINANGSQRMHLGEINLPWFARVRGQHPQEKEFGDGGGSDEH